MLDQFAKLLGIPLRASEDALHSERLAQATLTRRDLFGGALALLCSGAAMSLPLQRDLSTLSYWWKGEEIFRKNVDSTTGHAVVEGHEIGNTLLFDTIEITDPVGRQKFQYVALPYGIRQTSCLNIEVHWTKKKLPFILEHSLDLVV